MAFREHEYMTHEGGVTVFLIQNYSGNLGLSGTNSVDLWSLPPGTTILSAWGEVEVAPTAASPGGYVRVYDENNAIVFTLATWVQTTAGLQYFTGTSGNAMIPLTTKRPRVRVGKTGTGTGLTISLCLICTRETGFN